VCEDFTRIDCAVYAIGGWADGYSNAVPRLLAGLDAPRKGLIGPWAHIFPHHGVPGPAIGYLQEALRWWDHWLKDEATGIMDEPMLRVWMQDYAAPEPFHAQSPGRWVAEQSWPSERIQSRRWHLTGTSGLEDRPLSPATLGLSSPQTTGLAGGNWCGFGGEGDAPLDQRSDDGRSLVFDSAPLEDDLEILGMPSVELVLRSDQPLAMVAVRLNDVAPDGTSARVSFGLLNLTHRHGHAEPEALVPGETFRLRIELNAIAHRFEPGHLIRLALSTSYWPMAWPPPAPVMLELDTGDSCLDLPLRPPDPADAALAEFAAPESGDTSSTHTALEPPRFTRSIERDLVTDAVNYRLISEGGDLGAASLLRIEEIDLELGHHVERHYRIDDRDPLSACTEVIEKMLLRRGDWEVRVRARTELSASATHFILRAWLEADEGGETVFRRDWEERIERDGL